MAKVLMINGLIFLTGQICSCLQPEKTSNDQIDSSPEREWGLNEWSK